VDGFLYAKLFVELVYATAGVYQLLFAGVEGVAFGADLDFDVGVCAPSLDGFAACATNNGLFVVGMDSSSHLFFTSFAGIYHF